MYTSPEKVELFRSVNKICNEGKKTLVDQTFDKCSIKTPIFISKLKVQSCKLSKLY